MDPWVVSRHTAILNGRLDRPRCKDEGRSHVNFWGQRFWGTANPKAQGGVCLPGSKRRELRLKEGAGENVRGAGGPHVELGSHRFLREGEWKPLEGFEPKECHICL